MFSLRHKGNFLPQQIGPTNDPNGPIVIFRIGFTIISWLKEYCPKISSNDVYAFFFHFSGLVRGFLICLISCSDASYQLSNSVSSIAMKHFLCGTFLFFFQVEPIRNLFAALFLASIGMLIHVHFLWNHIDILLAAVILVIIIKTVVVTLVVRGFRYNNKTSLLVCLTQFLLFKTVSGCCFAANSNSYTYAGWDVSCTNWGIRFCSS